MRNKIAMILIAVSVFGLAAPAHASHEREFGKCLDYVALNRYIAAEFDIEFGAVDYMMWRESRCTKTAHNPNDANGGSYGLFQINRFWCMPNKYSSQGFLQENGVLKFCYELFDPYTNARAFIAIYSYGLERYGNGWGPWGGEPRWN